MSPPDGTCKPDMLADTPSVRPLGVPEEGACYARAAGVSAAPWKCRVREDGQCQARWTPCLALAAPRSPAGICLCRHLARRWPLSSRVSSGPPYDGLTCLARVSKCLPGGARRQQRWCRASCRQMWSPRRRARAATRCTCAPWTGRATAAPSSTPTTWALALVRVRQVVSAIGVQSPVTGRSAHHVAWSSTRARQESSLQLACAP